MRKVTESGETDVLVLALSNDSLNRRHRSQDREYAGVRCETRRKLDRILLLSALLSKALNRRSSQRTHSGPHVYVEGDVAWLVVDLVVDIRVSCSVNEVE